VLASKKIDVKGQDPEKGIIVETRRTRVRCITDRTAGEAGVPKKGIGGRRDHVSSVTVTEAKERTDRVKLKGDESH